MDHDSRTCPHEGSPLPKPARGGRGGGRGGGGAGGGGLPRQTLGDIGIVDDAEAAAALADAGVDASALAGARYFSATLQAIRGGACPTRRHAPRSLLTSRPALPRCRATAPADVDPEDFDGIVDTIQEIAEVDVNAHALYSASTERGTVAERLHVQIMLGSTRHETAMGVNAAIKAALTRKFGAGKYKVSVKRLTGQGGVHSDVLTAMGYTFKDREKPWYKNRCSHLLTPRLQEIALSKYMLFAKLAGKGIVWMDNKIIFDRVYAFLHVRGVEPIMLNANGTIRGQTVIVLMLRCGEYNLAKSFATSSFGAMDYARAQALVNLQMDPINCKLIDVQLLLFGLGEDDEAGFGFWREEDATALPAMTQQQVTAAVEREAAEEEHREAGGGSDDETFLSNVVHRPRPETIALNLAFVKRQLLRLLKVSRTLGPRLELHIFIGATGVGKTYGAKKRWPDSVDWLMEPNTKKPWWGNSEGKLPGRDAKVFIDDIVDNTDPDNLVCLLNWLVGRAVFSTGPCMLQTKHGKDVSFESSFIIATSTHPPEEWYTTPRGDVQPEWLRRLKDFATLYLVEMEHRTESGELTTVGVPYRDVVDARLAAREQRRASAAAAMDAALDDTSSDSG